MANPSNIECVMEKIDDDRNDAEISELWKLMPSSDIWAMQNSFYEYILTQTDAQLL